MPDNVNDKNLRRKQLEEKFKDGAIPQESDFKDLINSMINKQDDGFSKTDAKGFEIRINKPQSQKFISLYKDPDEPDVFFSIERNAEGTAVLLKPGEDSDAENNADKENPHKNDFLFGKDGKMGIGIKAADEFKLEVNGFAGMKGRIGTYNSNTIYEEVLADGEWHEITPELDNCNGFEVMARAGIKGTGKFALMHAVAVATFGPKGKSSKRGIRRTSTCYGFFWNKLSLRWEGSTHKYQLMIRSNSNYGNNAKIIVKITHLWDDETFADNTYKKAITRKNG